MLNLVYQETNLSETDTDSCQDVQMQLLFKNLKKPDLESFLPGDKGRREVS